MAKVKDRTQEFAEIDRRLEVAYEDACSAHDNYEFVKAYREWWSAHRDRIALERKVAEQAKARERLRNRIKTDEAYRQKNAERMRIWRANLSEEERERIRKQKLDYKKRNIEKFRERDREYRKRKRALEKAGLQK